MQKVSVKICGIKTKDALEAAISGGAAFAGLNFFRPSPRFIDFDQAAALARPDRPACGQGQSSKAGSRRPGLSMFTGTIRGQLVCDSYISCGTDGARADRARDPVR